MIKRTWYVGLSKSQKHMYVEWRAFVYSVDIS
jgi:hypothetical protein